MRLQVPRLVAWIFSAQSVLHSPTSPYGSRTAAWRARWLAAAPLPAAATTAFGNRDDPHDNVKELQLHVAVIPALRLKPAADPLFILSGGPGQAASDFYLSVAPAFARVRRDRDLVLVDQRGTGRSNRLDCELPDDSEFIVLDPQKLQAAVRECLAALPGDPRYYTTSVAVRDLDDVRAALGYPHAEPLRDLVRHAGRATLHASLSGSGAHSDSRWCRACGSRTRTRCRDRSAACDGQHPAALRSRRGLLGQVSRKSPRSS